MDSDKFYYLKLNQNFFGTEEIKIIEDLPDGVIYSNLLLKLYLLSLNSKGVLRLSENELKDENIKNSDSVNKDLKALATLGFIERIEQENPIDLESYKITEETENERDEINLKEIEQREDYEGDKLEDSSLNLKKYFENKTEGIWSLNIVTLKNIIKKHGYENVKAAIDTAVRENKWTMAYVNRILKRWAADGYPYENKKDNESAEVAEFVENEITSA